MSDDEPVPIGNIPDEALAACLVDQDGHCVTCSDEALPARVVRTDPELGLAWVAMKDATEEIDITLVDDVRPGQLLLVHGGVAIAHLEPEL